MPKVRKKKADCPAKTTGTRLADKARAKANALSEGRRSDLFNRGMAAIYGSSGKKRLAPETNVVIELALAAAESIFLMYDAMESGANAKRLKRQRRETS